MFTFRKGKYLSECLPKKKHLLIRASISVIVSLKTIEIYWICLLLILFGFFVLLIIYKVFYLPHHHSSFKTYCFYAFNIL